MFINLKGRVSDIFEGANKNYVTFNDTVHGGSIKLGLPKTSVVKLDGLYDMTIEAKAGMGKDGLYLSVQKLTTKGE